MKIGNIVPRTGIEPISLVFQASVLPLHHVGALMSPLYPCLSVYAAPCLRDQYRLLQMYTFGCAMFGESPITEQSFRVKKKELIGLNS